MTSFTRRHGSDFEPGQAPLQRQGPNERVNASGAENVALDSPGKLSDGMSSAWVCRWSSAPFIGVPGRKSFPPTTSLARLAASRPAGREARRSTRLGAPLAASRAKGVDRRNLHGSRLTVHDADRRSSSYLHRNSWRQGDGRGSRNATTAFTSCGSQI